MSGCTFQKRSRELCKEFGYHRVGGYDPETGSAWAIKKNGAGMFHVFAEDGQSFYDHMYMQVTKYQEGFACAKNNDGIWIHIDAYGFPAYPHHYRSVGLFFEGLADAADNDGQFHIMTDGMPAYDERYEHVGHFCHDLAQAMNSSGHFHIKRDGTPAYSLRGLRNGPYNTDGFARTEIVKIVDGKKRKVWVTINTLGEIID